MASVILRPAHRFRQLRKPRGEIGVAKGASGECDLATENENVPSLSKGLRVRGGVAMVVVTGALK